MSSESSSEDGWFPVMCRAPPILCLETEVPGNGTRMKASAAGIIQSSTRHSFAEEFLGPSFYDILTVFLIDGLTGMMPVIRKDSVMSNCDSMLKAYLMSRGS